MDILVAGTMKSLNKSAREVVEDMSGVILDVSQSHTRIAATNKGVHRCLTTSTQNYSFKHDRFITPFESLLFQGYPSNITIPSQITSADLKEFAGEGMCLPCLATVIWSVYKHMDWLADVKPQGVDPQ